jgi:peptidoglycan/xylan/chitin deacetylase (PgdA/CDA1 family)/glycosyltransferase involved in cell wall biosynthesis
MIDASIIIPTYNRAERLRACLEALCRSTAMTNFEVVVVVDGSTDGTREMLASFRAPYLLRVIYQSNAGQCAALNSGARAAQGRICIFLDDDIIASPKLVAEHLQLHAGRDQVVGVGQMALTLPANADWFARWFAQDWNDHYARLNEGTHRPDWEDCYGGNFSVARAEFLNVGGFAVDLPRAYDNELAYRLKRRGCSFVYLPHALGNQDERKGLHALVVDAEQSGASSAELYRRHPPTLAKLLGTFPEQRPVWALLWRVFLVLDISVDSLERFRSLLGKRTETCAWFRFFYRYSFWRGVRRALPNSQIWQRLTRGTPILMYHAFGAPGEQASRYVVPVRRFVLHMAWLKWMRYRVLTLEEFLRYRLDYRLPPARSIVITLDDGYADNWTLAYPILERFRYPATIFLTSGAAEQVNRWDSQGELAGRPLLSRSNIQEMLKRGVQFGAHTRTHPDLTTVSLEQARDEMAGSREDLERKLGAPIRFFSYPFGKHNEGLESTAAEVGFLGSCGIDVGSNTPVTPLHALRRVEVYGTDSLLDFALAVRFGGRSHSLWKRLRLLALHLINFVCSNRNADSRHPEEYAQKLD